MFKNRNHFTAPLLRMIVIASLLPLLCAWVDPVDMSEDVNGTSSITIGGETVESCTSNIMPSAPQCHRWNLVWAPVVDSGTSQLTLQADWAPHVESVTDEWRLPTIKELTKLITFGEKNTGTLIESPTIKNWFTDRPFWSDNATNFFNGTKTVWLISSSYRDIDDNIGDDISGAKGQAQVFAINIINGEIKTFEPGYKAPVATVEQDDQLKLCASLKNTGECEYGMGVENIVFALKVRTKTAKYLSL
ncbi:hypothetical protein ACU6U9_21720 [Pseudomonas sp. HK3]